MSNLQNAKSIASRAIEQVAAHNSKAAVVALQDLSNLIAYKLRVIRRVHPDWPTQAGPGLTTDQPPFEQADLWGDQ